MICRSGVSLYSLAHFSLPLPLSLSYEWWFDINMQPVGNSSFTDMTVRRQGKEGPEVQVEVVVEGN